MALLSIWGDAQVNDEAAQLVGTFSYYELGVDDPTFVAAYAAVAATMCRDLNATPDLVCP